MSQAVVDAWGRLVAPSRAAAIDRSSAAGSWCIASAESAESATFRSDVVATNDASTATLSAGRTPVNQ